MRYLITGAQGFVGRYLTERLLRAPDAEVLGIGRSPMLTGAFTHCITLAGGKRRAPFPASLVIDARRYHYRAVDILDQAALSAQIDAYRPDVIVHLASGLWGDDPAKLAATNVGGIVSLIAAAAAANCAAARLVIGSSGAIYGIPDSLPISETAVARPAEIYGVSKLIAEKAALAAARSTGMAVMFGRIFNVIGPGADERHAPARFAEQVTAIVRNPEQALEVGDLDTTRDFIDVRDVAEALFILAERGVGGEAYNVGSGVETRLTTILSGLVDRAQIDPRILRSHFRKADIPRHVASIERLRSLGFVPSVTLDDSLTEMLDYYAARNRQEEVVP